MDKRIELVVAHIDKNLDLSYNLDDLANMACLSPSQFHRLFKKSTAKTPFKYIEELKMEKAYELITNTNRSIQRIASDLGYHDYETLSRAFKRMFKLSPDDLKAIFIKLRATHENNEIIVAPLEIENEDLLMEVIKELLSKITTRTSELKDAKIYKIKKKSSENIEPHLLIKNKYEIADGNTIKKLLLK